MKNVFFALSFDRIKGRFVILCVYRVELKPYSKKILYEVVFLEKKLYIAKSEYCLMCGKEIPEGRQVCLECEKSICFENEIPDKTEQKKTEKSLLKRFFSR